MLIHRASLAGVFTETRQSGGETHTFACSAPMGDAERQEYAVWNAMQQLDEGLDRELVSGFVTEDWIDRLLFAIGEEGK